MGNERPDGILKAVARGRGGIRVEHNKLTQDKPTVRCDIPEKVTLPMQQHVGAPCTPVVKVGDTVACGQLIGDSDKYVSAPIHASISGKVISIADTKLANGRIAPAVTIESDGEMRLWEGIEPPHVTNKEELVAAVRKSGLVGLGGAGFPTHIKLNTPPDKKIEYLIINAAECEPYITVDYRACLDNSDNIINGVLLLQKYLNIPNVIIAVEDNKPEAIKVMNRVAHDEKDVNDSIKVMALKSRYPQGAEKMLVLSATGRKVPLGKLPSDVGCMVLNVAGAAFIGRYLETGKPLISRSITVSGNCIKNPQNVRVPVGMSIRSVIDFCGGFSQEPYKIIAGGPMMGTSLYDVNIPLLKNNNAVLALSETGARLKPERDCIRCGRCHEACPMSLIPTEISKYVKLQDAEMLRACGIDVCMECGSCAYSCPSGKPLVQYLRLAKQIVKEATPTK